MKNNTKIISLKELCIIIIITGLFTGIATSLIMYNKLKLNYGIVNINNDEALKQFLKVYQSVNDDYYENVNKEEMIDKAIKGMLDYLNEDYSKYLNQNETNALASELKGKYKGIGITLIETNKVYKVHNNTPASEAGLKENDIIIKINDEEIDNESTIDIINLIKEGENIFTVKREDEEVSLKITPREINIPLTRNVYEKNDKKIGYIYIPSFTETVSEEFTKALKELEEKDISSLIIDVRSNTGGYLKEAANIASIFLEKGKIIYQLESKNDKSIYKDQTDEKRDYEIIVLINEGSASASEVLATSLSESYGAKTVGTVSYGKGKVQQTKTLEDGSMVKYTTAKWLTPDGNSIDGMGIFPTYSVQLEKDSEDKVIEDNQLKYAIELLS